MNFNTETNVNWEVKMMDLIKFIRLFNPNVPVPHAKVLAEYWREYASDYTNPVLYFQGFARFVNMYVVGEWVVEGDNIVHPSHCITDVEIKKVAW